LYAIAV